MISAVIFDMDGLLLDSEIYWERARKQFGEAIGCDWRHEDELSAKGKNSPEWAELIKERCHVEMSIAEIIRSVSDRMRRLYDEHLPLLPGAVSVVREVSAHYATGIASSSPPDLIEYAMDHAGIRECFAVIMSADTVGRGKPHPDVFLVAARELGSKPDDVAVFEDSTAGITAGVNAGMKVIAVPNQHYPPDKEALEKADIVLKSLEQFEMSKLEDLR